MWNLDFIPNSPTLMNAGTGEGTMSACYVMDIPDSMEDIMRVAHDQAMIEKFGVHDKPDADQSLGAH